MKAQQHRFVHIILGTKGEFVKVAPIIKELDNRRIRYNLIFTGQHTQILEELRTVFEIKKPDFYLHQRDDDIAQMRQVPFWYLRCIIRSIRYKRNLWQECDGICLIHGDTPSTLLGLMIAMLHNMRIAHVESGLRSYNFLNPFPEELIRIITSRFADYLFAPSAWAVNNLIKGIIKGKIFNTEGNTVFDAIEYVLARDIEQRVTKSPYVVAAIHRIETLYVKERCDIIVHTIQKIAQKWNVIFVGYKPTIRKLINYGLMNELDQNPNVVISPYYNYAAFIKLVKNALFIITDGGGLQEETYYLNIPCLLMRKKTERQEGLNLTSYLSDFRMSNVNYFLDHYESFRRTSNLVTKSPSKFIVDTLMNS